MRRRLKIFIFLILAVLLPLVITNEIIRFTWYRRLFLVKFLRKDWELMSSLQPGFEGKFQVGLLNYSVWKGTNAEWELKVNSQGLRSFKEIGPRPANVFRIICLGDSTTFGLDLNYPDTYPAQLASILESAVAQPARIETINAGVPTYSSRQGLVALSTRLTRYQPDLVIVELGFNDEGSRTLGYLSPTDNQLLPGDIRNGFSKIYRSPLNLAYFELDRQPLIAFAKNLFLNWVMVFRLYPAINEMAKHPQPAGVEEKRERRAEAFKRSRISRVPASDLVANYEGIADLAEKNGFRLVFYIPYVLHPAYRFLILTVAQEHHIPVVDFYGKMMQYKLEMLAANPVYAELLSDYRHRLGDDFLRKNPQYLVTTDGLHPNAVGNRIIAEKIAKVILSQRAP